MAFCSQCGTQVADGSAFCPNCGKPVGQTQASGASPTPAPPPASNSQFTSAPIEENIAGMLAYFTIIPAILFLVIEPYKRNRFVRFHCFQCLFTAVALIAIHVVLGIIGSFLPLLVLPIYGLLGLAELALWVLLVFKAYQHQIFKLPIVGDMAEQQANAV